MKRVKKKATKSSASQRLIGEIHDIHTSAWASATPPTSRRQAEQQAMVNSMRTLSVGLMERGVTSAILEGAYLIWWLRIACTNHGFSDGGFERSLERIGPLIGPVSDIMIRLGDEIKDDGPTSEMQRLGEKLEELRGLCGGSVATWPTSREAEVAQTELAHTTIQQTLQIAMDMDISPDVIESTLLYFWFRCTANRYGLNEMFFQKLERHWDVVMDHINRYMDEQAGADRVHV